MKNRNFLDFLRSLAIGLGAMLLAVSVVFAATTIGTNVNTTGTLTSSGLSSFTTVTSTSATTTAYLYIGDDITEPAGWDFSRGDLIAAGNVYFANLATTSAALWVGSGGTINNLGMSGGDLYVQDDVEIDSSLWFVQGTTSDSLTIGGYASTTGDLFVNGGTIDSVTSTATSTMGIFSRSHSAGTSTVSIGNGEQGIGGCLEMIRKEDGNYVRCFISGATNFVCITGRCNE